MTKSWLQLNRPAVWFGGGCVCVCVCSNCNKFPPKVKWKSLVTEVNSEPHFPDIYCAVLKIIFAFLRSRTKLLPQYQIAGMSRDNEYSKQQSEIWKMSELTARDHVIWAWGNTRFQIVLRWRLMFNIKEPTNVTVACVILMSVAFLWGESSSSVK